jgi:hypothetical protein
MKPIKHSNILLLLLLLFSLACTKYEPGPKGDPGTPGAAGNLILSEFTKTLDSLDWSKSEITWVAEIFADQITSNVLLKGEVKVYVNEENKWWVLPFGKDYIFTQSSVTEGKIRLINEHIHGGVPARPARKTYRVVILSPAN